MGSGVEVTSSVGSGVAVGLGVAVGFGVAVGSGVAVTSSVGSGVSVITSTGSRVSITGVGKPALTVPPSPGDGIAGFPFFFSNSFEPNVTPHITSATKSTAAPIMGRVIIFFFRASNNASAD